MSIQITRRQALQTGAGILTAGVVSGLCAAEDEAPLIIDCHAHIYGEDEKKYPTVADPYRPPKGKGTVAHLQREMQANGVRYVTAIQTSTFYRWDNRFTVESAVANKDRMVAVCTLNPDDAKSPKLLEEYARSDSVRGMRSVPASGGKLDDPGVRSLWKVAERTGIVINVLVGREKRQEVEKMVSDFSKLRVVIDHCLNLRSGPNFQLTLDDMLTLSKYPNVHAKLTFIATGTDEDYPGHDMHEACLKIINEFGPKRCVWGSDFPCELWCPKFSYAQHLNVFRNERGLDATSKKAILGETAFGLWFKQN